MALIGSRFKQGKRAAFAALALTAAVGIGVPSAAQASPSPPAHLGVGASIAKILHVGASVDGYPCGSGGSCLKRSAAVGYPCGSDGSCLKASLAAGYPSGCGGCSRPTKVTRSAALRRA